MNDYLNDYLKRIYSEFAVQVEPKMNFEGDEIKF